MAPQQRKKDKRDEAKEKAKESKIAAKKEADENKPPTFMERHVLKVQMSLMFGAFLVSVIPRYLQGHDRYRYEDSYKDPIAWHRTFAKEYSEVFEKWGYSLHVNTTERLHTLLHDSKVEAAGANVLDLGTGSGLVGLELKRLGYQHITGIDVVPEILQVADTTRAYERLITADIEAVPSSLFTSQHGTVNLTNSSFDAVLCVGTSGYLARGEFDADGPSLDHSRTMTAGPQAEAARVHKLLEEWLRLLKPGGILGLTAEDLLKTSWEEAFDAFTKAGLLSRLDAVGPMVFVPFNGDKQTASQTAHIYFHQKLE